MAARSGLQSKEMVLAEWAKYAGFYAEQPGRDWRSVEDTTHDPIFGARKAKPFASQARGEDYYNEGSLVWLATDMTIRELSRGTKSLDDFAKAFFGVRDADWGVLTYDFDEVVRTLNAVQPYDWAKFLDTKLRQPGQPVPLTGIEKGGYKLVWKEEPNIFDKEIMKEGSNLNLIHSLGLTLDKDGKVTSVLLEQPRVQGRHCQCCENHRGGWHRLHEGPPDRCGHRRKGRQNAYPPARRTQQKIRANRHRLFRRASLSAPRTRRYKRDGHRPPADAAPQMKKASKCVLTLSPPVTMSPTA